MTDDVAQVLEVLLAHDEHGSHLLVRQVPCRSLTQSGNASSRPHLYLFQLLHDFGIFIDIALLLEDLLALLLDEAIYHLLVEFRLHHALVVDVVDRALDVVHLD